MNRSLFSPWTLRVSQLCFDRGGRALLDRLSFELAAGEVLHIAGANGCGKTTLLRILAALLLPSSGQVTWCELGSKSDRRLAPRTLYVGHQHAMHPGLTVTENFQRLCLFLGQPIVDQEQLDYILDTWALNRVAHQVTDSLSFGQKKRLSLCQLSLSRDEVWILDEPWTGLDIDCAAKLRTLIDERAHQQGMVILTTHLDAVSVHGWKQLVLSDGVIVSE